MGERCRGCDEAGPAADDGQGVRGDLHGRRQGADARHGYGLYHATAGEGENHVGELFQTRGLEEQTCLQPSIADAREDDARCGECGAGCEGRRQGVEHRAKGGRSGHGKIPGSVMVGEPARREHDGPAESNEGDVPEDAPIGERGAHEIGCRHGGRAVAKYVAPDVEQGEADGDEYEGACR